MTTKSRLGVRSDANGRTGPPRRTVNGKRVVLLGEREYDRLLRKADEWEPALPEPLPNGNVPALEFMRVSLARSIIRDRRRLGWFQNELARRVGVRLQTLARIEQAKATPSEAIIKKIDRALKKAEQV